MIEFSDEKFRLMQDKGLLHRLYMMQLSGSKQLEPHENAHIADMILRRSKKCDLILNIDDGVDLDNVED